jgi:hypothetical protein
MSADAAVPPAQAASVTMPAQATTGAASLPGAAPNPSEVGWQFVPQYYTFVNKHPNRLHCFYTKASTFLHGTEGEESVIAHGQQVGSAHIPIALLFFPPLRRVFVLDASVRAGCCPDAFHSRWRWYELSYFP